MKKITYIFWILISGISFSQNYNADFALYDPSYENDGVWEEEVKALKALFVTYNWTYEVIDHIDINTGILGSGSNRKYKALIAPGGYAYFRELAVTPTGEDNIRNFINSGGNYIGFCAGAYWAADTLSWAEFATGNGGEYNQPSDYSDTDYNLNLFDGVAKGPFGWEPWQNGTNPSLQMVNINLNNSTMQSIGLPDTTRFFYYGGPVFTNIKTQLPGYEVWANAIAPSGIPADAKTGDGEPTIIKYNYGNGTVILFSYHPEVLINSDVDNLYLSEFFNENDINWDTGNQTFDEINLDSWNIVHAALQIAANQQVTQITSLPVIVKAKIFLEGPYNSSAMNSSLLNAGIIPKSQPYNNSPWNYNGQEYASEFHPDIVDWVLVELFSSPDNSSKIDTRAAFVNSEGAIVDLDSLSGVRFNVQAGNYYIGIVHRTHLDVLSADSISIPNNNIYDFTTNKNKFYGNNGAVELEPGIWGMWCGDSDGSGVIDASDRNSTWNNRNKTGYENPDVDLSGVVDAADRNKTWNNRNKFSEKP